MSPTEIRTRLAVNGFVPLPCCGKSPVLPKWQLRTETSDGDLAIWAATFPDATNTGVLTASVPCLDLDILDPVAVDAAVELVQDRFGECGKVMLRYGRRPKVAVLFRTDAPFSKIQVLLTAPDGSAGEKIEFLGHGQQVVVDGVHPDTRALYEWRDGNPCNTRRDELPLIDEVEAQALVDDIAALMVEHGYQVANGKSKANGNGADPNSDDTRADWGYLYENIRAGHDLHDSLRDLSCNLIKAHTDPGAVVNQLRDLMDRCSAPHDERWQVRRDDIWRLVKGAERFVRETGEEASIDIDAEIMRLAKLTEIEYQQQRKDAADKMDIRPSALDKFVNEKRAELGRKPTKCPETAEAGPAPDGGVVLGLARDYLKKYAAYPSDHALVAHTLWCAHCHLLEAFDSTPRIAFLSAFPKSGKTRALEATEPLVCRPVSTVNASANYLFRKAGDAAGPPTVLFDEIDTIFGPKAKEHEDIRGFINSGHRKGATYGRCRVVGNSVIAEESPCYAAVAMAGLGWLPDTVLSRSVVIRMDRQLKSEKVTPFRTRTSIPEGQAIGVQLARWARSVFDAAVAARPELPEGVEDRQADAWEPLLVVADLVGGDWPRQAREAATTFAKINRKTPPSTKLRLLRDSRLVFWQNLMTALEARPKGLLTETVLNGLHSLEDAPWRTINKGDPFTDHDLAQHMEDYGVEPTHLRPWAGSTKQRRGYTLGSLTMVWRRYLDPFVLPLECVTTVTDVTREALDEFFVWVSPNEVTPVTPVTDPERDPKIINPSDGVENAADTSTPSADTSESVRSPMEIWASDTRTLPEGGTYREEKSPADDAERNRVANFAHILTRQLKDED
jgi:hypothetical protein